jgi:parvulin-like peptidyl-prolyl isomerase
LEETQINKEILEALNKMDDGSITKPIRIPSGFLILKKISSKKIERELDFEKELKKQRLKR